MRHLIVGDIHGFHQNLRDFLTDVKLIDTKGNRINRENFKVYSVGDLIDGDVNRRGDILCLDFAEEWFDGICLGNHEFAFMGGKDFGVRRKHDRATLTKLLNLVDKGVYVPAILIGETLVTHGGLSDHFGFKTAADAYEYIRIMWEMAPDIDDDIAIFDWGTSSSTNYSYATSTDGIFQLDWTDKRNDNFAQIVGHSTYYTGPVHKKYDNDIVHWNVDVGAKTGLCVGGIVLDDVTGEVEIHFYGDRNSNGFTKAKKTYPPKGEVMTYDPKATVPLSQTLLPVTVKETTKGPTPATNPKSTQSIGAVITDSTSMTDELDMAIINDPEILEAFRTHAMKEQDACLQEFVKEHK